MKVFLLEDDPLDADLARRSLISAIPDCIVEVASSLAEARKLLFSDSPFDIGLLDMKLPDGNGLELLMEIRQKELKIAIIILTGSEDEEVAEMTMKAGANDFVVKRQDYLTELPGNIHSALIRFNEDLHSRSGAEF